MEHRTDVFWNELNALTPAAGPLPAAAHERLHRAVCARVHAELADHAQQAPARPAKAAGRHARAWALRLAGCAAACLALLGGTGLACPALAEELPLVGGVFAWLNSRDKAQLQSETLDEAAAPAGVPAQADDPAAAEPCPLTLESIYCDGLYLRLAVTLRDPEGRLDAYDTITSEHRILESAGELQNGELLLDGERTGECPRIGPVLTRLDEATFAGDLLYRWPESAAPGEHAAQLTLFTLGVDGVWGEDGYTQQDLPGGDRTLSFTVSADTSANRIWEGEQSENGYTLLRVEAAPGETRVTLRCPENADAPTVQLLADGAPLEQAFGQPQEGGSYSFDFAAAPAGSALSVRVVDKNHGDTRLAEFGVEFAQENR